MSSQLLDSLASQGFMLRLLGIVFSNTSSSNVGTCEAARDFFIRTVSALLVMPHSPGSNLLLSIFAGSTNLIDHLIHVITGVDDDSAARKPGTYSQNHSRTARRCCADIINVLFKLGSLTSNNNSNAKSLSIDNYVTSRRLQALLCKSLCAESVIRRICHFVIDEEAKRRGSVPLQDDRDEYASFESLWLSAYCVRSKFTALRLAVVNILAWMLRCGEANRVLNVIDAFENALIVAGQGHEAHESVWGVLCTWFFEYPHCNLYHTTFCDMICQVFQYQHYATVVTLLRRPLRFLTVMLRLHSNPDIVTDNRGHIFIMISELWKLHLSLQETRQSKQPLHGDAAVVFHILQTHSLWYEVVLDLEAEQEMREQEQAQKEEQELQEEPRQQVRCVSPELEI